MAIDQVLEWSAQDLNDVIIYADSLSSVYAINRASVINDILIAIFERIRQNQQNALI